MDEKMKREAPKLVLVTGAPGAGKSTLAKQLAKRLGFEYVDSDAILEEYWHENKNNPSYDREKIGIPRFFSYIEGLASSGSNIVTDALGRKERDEQDFIRLNNVAKLIIIHCQAKDPTGRFYSRELKPDGTEPDWLAETMSELGKYHHLDVNALEVGSPVIEVDTNNGYKPTLNEITSRIEKLE